MRHPREYGSEDGLNVLTYLGIKNITEGEREVFRNRWSEFYQSHKKDFIGTVWVLYAEALPFECGDGDKGSFALAQLRDNDFGRRLEATKLEEKLNQGILLEYILKKEKKEDKYVKNRSMN